MTERLKIVPEASPQPEIVDQGLARSDANVMVTPHDLQRNA